jgi:hypothetical protein
VALLDADQDLGVGLPHHAGDEEQVDDGPDGRDHDPGPQRQHRDQQHRDSTSGTAQVETVRAEDPEEDAEDEGHSRALLAGDQLGLGGQRP